MCRGLKCTLTLCNISCDVIWEAIKVGKRARFVPESNF